MEYKERLLNEFTQLVRNSTRLLSFLDEQDEESTLDKEYLDLLREQLDIMSHYEYVLEERILLEMK